MSIATSQGDALRKLEILRCLRIAFSAVCGVLCLLLIALWVRSYFMSDYGILDVSRRYRIQVVSFYGRFGVCPMVAPNPTLRPGAFSFGSVSLSQIATPDYTSANLPSLGLRRLRVGDHEFITPYWLVVSIIAVVSMLPWLNWGWRLPLRWRFSLRTLLIAITVIAAILGIIAISN